MSSMVKGPGDMQPPTTGRAVFDVARKAREIAAIDDPRQRNQALARVPEKLKVPVTQAVQMLFRRRVLAATPGAQ